MAEDAVTQLATRLVYENRWLRMREDRVRRADGSEGIYSVLERADFAVICPAQDGHLHLVQQFRYPVGERCWELPMGTWEWREGITPAALAAAELAEETGLVAGTLIEIGTLFQAAGYSNQRGRSFFATDLTQGPLAREVEEQDMICRPFRIAEVERMIAEGVIRDVTTISCFSQARLRGFI